MTLEKHHIFSIISKSRICAWICGIIISIFGLGYASNVVMTDAEILSLIVGNYALHALQLEEGASREIITQPFRVVLNENMFIIGGGTFMCNEWQLYCNGASWNVKDKFLQGASSATKTFYLVHKKGVYVTSGNCIVYDNSPYLDDSVYSVKKLYVIKFREMTDEYGVKKVDFIFQEDFRMDGSFLVYER